MRRSQSRRLHSVGVHGLLAQLSAGRCRRHAELLRRRSLRLLRRQLPGRTKALIAVHGHSRDANKTFEATLCAVRNAGALGRHAGGRAALPGRMRTRMPAGAAPRACPLRRSLRRPGQGRRGLWRLMARRRPLGDGQPHQLVRGVMDALVAELMQRWPSLRTVTIAGFSAGAAVGAALYRLRAERRHGGKVAMRYVVADPSTWLYFDPVRPQLSSDGASSPELRGARCRGLPRDEPLGSTAPTTCPRTSVAVPRRRAGSMRRPTSATSKANWTATMRGARPTACSTSPARPPLKARSACSAAWPTRSTTARCSRRPSAARSWWCRAARMTWRASFRRKPRVPH